MKMRSLCCTLALLPVIGLFSQTSAAADKPASQARIIQIGEISSSNALKFTIKASQAKYAVGESMHFTVQAARPYYVYLYNQQPDGSNVLLYPNKKEKAKLLPANKAVTLPQLVRFFSDRPGVETVTAIATTQPLTIAPGQLKAAGDFSLVERGGVESALSARQIHIGEINNVPTATGDTVMRTLRLVVGSAPGAAPDTGFVAEPVPLPANVAAFITADKPSYRVGEPIQVTYGATAPGFVHLFVVYPDGGPATRLGKQQVNVGEAVSLSAVAALPAGRQLLVAAYSPKGELNEAFLKPLSTSTNFKGLVFVDQNGATIGAAPVANSNAQQVPAATFQIQIAQ